MGPSIQVMGIINLTPDSFYESIRAQTLDDTLRAVEKMLSEGASCIDIGPESTRPGATPIGPEVATDRLLRVLPGIQRRFISSVVPHPEVMSVALEHKVWMINDVAALQRPGALDLLAQSPNTQVCLMHMQADPTSMQQRPTYQSVTDEVHHFLRTRIQACVDAGLSRDALWIDPGFGFGKTVAHNLSLLKHLNQLESLGCPLLVGLSRKSMFGTIIGSTSDDRLPATLAAQTIAMAQGARMIRTHDVKATVWYTCSPSRDWVRAIMTHTISALMGFVTQNAPHC